MCVHKKEGRSHQWKWVQMLVLWWESLLEMWGNLWGGGGWRCHVGSFNQIKLAWNGTGTLAPKKDVSLLIFLCMQKRMAMANQWEARIWQRRNENENILLTPKVVGSFGRSGRDLLHSTRFRHKYRMRNKEIHKTPSKTHLSQTAVVLFFLAIHIFALV